MKIVAKLLIKNGGEYLMMYRSNHPTFGDDPDLPGGTSEESESGLVAMLREVDEEIGLRLVSGEVKEIYSGDEYSNHGTFYSLFIANLSEKPKVLMSWEHSSYEWMSKEEFIEKARKANDTYMHMVADVFSSLRKS